MIPVHELYKMSNGALIKLANLLGNTSYMDDKSCIAFIMKTLSFPYEFDILAIKGLYCRIMTERTRLPSREKILAFMDTIPQARVANTLFKYYPDSIIVILENCFQEFYYKLQRSTMNRLMMGIVHYYEFSGRIGQVSREELGDFPQSKLYRKEEYLAEIKWACGPPKKRSSTLGTSMANKMAEREERNNTQPIPLVGAALVSPTHLKALGKLVGIDVGKFTRYDDGNITLNNIGEIETAICGRMSVYNDVTFNDILCKRIGLFHCEGLRPETRLQIGKIIKENRFDLKYELFYKAITLYYLENIHPTVLTTLYRTIATSYLSKLFNSQNVKTIYDLLVKTDKYKGTPLEKLFEFLSAYDYCGPSYFVCRDMFSLIATTTSGKLSDHPEMCQICAETIAPLDLVTLPCGHSFCGECIFSWFTDREKCSCPNCRKVLPFVTCYRHFLQESIVANYEAPATK